MFGVKWLLTRLAVTPLIRRSMSVEADVCALVSVEWLQAARQQPDLRIIDGSWHMPAWKRDPLKEYKESHIPGALYFDLDACADLSAPLPHTLPSKETFADYVANLGINNSTRVVVYDNNAQFGGFSAQRVWWMFRVFGHDKVSVLNGGFVKWVEAGLETTAEVTSVDRQPYTADYRAGLVRHLADVEDNVKTQKCALLDARSKGRFDGTMPEPRPDIKPGRIVNSKSIPFPSFINADSKLFKSPEEIVALFENVGVSLKNKDPIIASCGSGVTACMIAFAAFLVGNRDVPVYDGAWYEFFLEAKPECKVLPK